MPVQVGQCAAGSRAFALCWSIVSAIALTGCDRVLVGRPATDDLIGKYSLTEASETFLRSHKGYSAVPSSFIELRPDFSVSIRNLPDCATDGFGTSKGGFLSGDGRWQLEKAFLGYGLTLDIRGGGSLKPGSYGGPWLAIRRRSSPHILELTVGDPDSGESIQYERRS
jgi:hypothetical protein